MSGPGVQPSSFRVAGLVLAAGRSCRMQGANKLLAPLGGLPLVAHAVDALIAVRLSQVVVVTGHQAEAVRAALAGRSVVFAHNDGFAHGLASSLRVGLAALVGPCDGAVVCLGDMPRVRAAHVEALLAAFAAFAARDICVPVHDGQRGNPVLWPARCFAQLQGLQGDVGGRALLDADAEGVRRVTIADDGVLVDADTPEALAELRRRARVDG